MPELFSTGWGEQYSATWNTDDEITSTLADAAWSSVVGFGFPDDDKPVFVMTIHNGKIISTDPVADTEIEWDIRATPENWSSLIEKPPGLMRLGIAYTSRKLRFYKGDYATMIKDAQLAQAFVKSFALMSTIQ